tara:strand:+ start:889 stop:1173 length:285 start_codon:yes stop_codon:yes gene_type:complete
MKIYDLSKDAVVNKPNLYCKHGIRPLYSLEKSKEIAIKYFTKYYDFNTKLDNYIENVKNCNNVYKIEYYICNALNKGLKIKSNINLSIIYKNKK